MNRTRLLSTVAALMLSAGTALAQAPAPSRDQAPAQPAPAAQQNAPAEKIAPPAQPIEPKASETKAPAASTTAVDSGKADMKTPPAAGKAEMKGAETNKALSPETSGQAGGAARLSTEQRSKISTVIRQQKVQPVTLNVSISVGTRVPRNVRFYPLPTEVVTIYPQWRGYDYVLVGSQILVLDPRTHEIVAILDA